MTTMGFLRRKKTEPEVHRFDEDGAPFGEDSEDRRSGYSASMADRMRRLETYSYEFDENEAEEVEARIRRMFYGAKVEDD
jgi:hypothetical protein